MTRTMRAADVLARRLHEAGCRMAFGMPGGEVLTLVDALEAAGIEFRLVKHENAAGFMAEGLWHRTGAPGIMVATLGPGAMNGVNVVANAHQDRVPLILLTGCVDAVEEASYTHQVMNHRAVFAPITKASFRLEPDAVDAQADKALGIATEPRAGPVHIDVPIAAAGAAVAVPPRPARRAGAAPLTPAPGPELERARAWLATAERPAMLVGLDALAEDAGGAIRDFADAWQIPFATTYKAKGLVDEDHPLCLGGAGLSPLADRSLVPLFGQADLVIAAGYDPIEMRPGWRDAWDPAHQNVIDIAPVPNHHYMHQAGLAFQSGVGPTLAALGRPGRLPPRWPGGEDEAARAALACAFPRDGDWGPAAVIDTCRSALPRDTLATADSGAHRILLSQIWTCHEPRGLMQSSGLCTMGCAIPLAIGAQIGAPERPVVAFTGDAGFLMVAGELATLAETGLAPIIVVFADASLALIELKQRGQQMKNAGVDFARHDFAAIARGFGGHGHDVSNRAELQAALDQALRADRFTVIAARIERGAYDGRI
ncbi:acetolactate synthase [Maritimibacter sp. 55A14]|uniref:thiamine pyrophosphate-binding protein n=1 Tax=Maritimibacter sp. 55A14 TaxID=2174844 RepID=UPI000D61F96D|nr:thiamine pyrophosphate-binding protein [Maritimibacter sp. 55A14]PWE34367.1 acetolactate synthase [Maritimibacter sp. 55A14]